MPKNYRSSLRAADFLSADVAIVANKWVEIGEKKIDAGVYLAIGFGYSNSQSDADGRIYAILKDTAGGGAEVTGTIRIAAYTPDELPISILAEFPTSKMNSSATDMTKQLPLPILGGPLYLGQDYRYKIFFRPDTVGNGTLSKTNSIIQLDVTKASKSGN